MSQWTVSKISVMTVTKISTVFCLTVQKETPTTCLTPFLHKDTISTHYDFQNLQVVTYSYIQV
jgi:hypothetical protein